MTQGTLPLFPRKECPGSLHSRGVKIRKRFCRSILSPSRLTDYSLNPYTGCAHDCAYCYAHYMQRYSGRSEPWGKFVDVKVNAARILARQARGIPPSSLFMSSVTDPYQPVERDAGITRALLQILAPLPHSLTIHTKSHLVERDIPLLEKFRKLSVTFTIVTGDETAARVLEPGASTVRNRIRVLKKLAEHGIRTGVFIGPIIPFVTEKKLQGLLYKLAQAGVKKIMLDDLHYLSRIGYRLYPALKRYDPSLVRKFNHIPEDYAQEIASVVVEFCRKRGIWCRACFKR